MVTIEFSIVLDRGEPQLPDAFLPGKKILILAKVITFLNLEFTGNYTTSANFNRDLRKTKNLATKKLTPPSFCEAMAWNMEVIFFKLIRRTHLFRIFEFRLHFFIMGNIRHEVFLSQLKNYNMNEWMSNIFTAQQMKIYYQFQCYIKELLECAEGKHQVNSLNCLKGLPLRTKYVYINLYSPTNSNKKSITLVYSQQLAHTVNH